MMQKYEHIFKKLIYIWLFFSLITFTFLIPPFQKPDEINHFLRATALAKGELFCMGKPGENKYFIIPHNFYDLPDQMSANVLRYRYNEKFPLHAITKTQSTDTQPVVVHGLCALPFPGYVSNAIGLEMGLLLNNPLVAIYLGRLSAGIIFILCVIFALRRIPQSYQPIVYLFAFIPMVMHQATAISYDSLQLSLLIVIFSLFLHYLTLPKLNKKQIVFFLFLLGCFAAVKTGYYPILLLFFVIPYKKITNNFRYYLLSIIVIGLIGIVLTLISAKIAFANLPGNGTINPQLQLHYLLQNPFASLHILFSTFQKFGDFYYQSFIGYFGWLDFQLNYFVYEIYTVIIGMTIYLLIKSNQKPLINKKQFVVLLFVICITTGMIFLSQYLDWSPIASYIVNGVQGRYFLVLFPITLFTIVQFALLIGKKNFYILVGIGCMAFFMINTLFTIYNRYYNYANIFANEHPYKKLVKTISTASPEIYTTIPINKSYTFIYNNPHMDKTIDGFNFIFVTNKNDFSTAYEYTLKDAQCNHVLKHSFLDLNKLQDKTRPSDYEEKFSSPVEKGNDRLCLTVSPFSTIKNGDYLNLIKYKQQILFEPIFNR